MNAAGYADLAAKIVSGADWILSDALEIEPIHDTAWSFTQPRLREWLSDPRGVRSGNSRALSGLAEGLLMTGFGMQTTKSSRPASGAEHQFSHLWDMQHHTYKGRIPFHGFKVGIGTLCSAFFYECLLETDVDPPRHRGDLRRLAVVGVDRRTNRLHSPIRGTPANGAGRTAREVRRAGSAFRPAPIAETDVAGTSHAVGIATRPASDPS